MKKLLVRLIIFAAAAVSLVSSASAANIGDKIGTVYNTDIVAYINHYAIPSYAANGTSVVVAEELANFGFDVVWDGNTRTLSISRNANATPSEMNVVKYGTPNTEYADLLYTDIVVYADGIKIPSYAINGYTMIPMESLTMFGECNWVPEQRALKMWVDGLHVRSDMQAVVSARSVKANAQNLVSGLSDKQRYELNIFLSNFSEIDLPDYDCLSPDNNVLIHFGCRHNSHNHTAKAIHISDEEAGRYIYLDDNIHSCYKVSGQSVENDVSRFFGMGVSHGSVSVLLDYSNYGYTRDYTYTNGYYYFDHGEEGAVDVGFAIADTMYENYDGTYTVSFKYYGSGFIDAVPEAYYFTPDTYVEKGVLIGSGTAIIKPYNYNGRNTYQLLKYSQRANRR